MRHCLSFRILFDIYRARHRKPQKLRFLSQLSGTVFSEAYISDTIDIIKNRFFCSLCVVGFIADLQIFGMLIQNAEDVFQYDYEVQNVEKWMTEMLIGSCCN